MLELEGKVGRSKCENVDELCVGVCKERFEESVLEVGRY